ncbi:uncharacterized protein LOC135383188 [Ornithodoros turicata]|uniref:uncharacterized protein LOC135383188 n=1 Tax=Ornithodoros turicata TaxID=34597 RepID=UPI003138B473
MVRLPVTFVVVLLAYLEFSTTPVSGNMPCGIHVYIDWISRIVSGGRCLDYRRITYNGKLVSCSYMCNPANYLSCYLYEGKGSSCLIFDPPSYGICFGGECYQKPDYEQFSKGKELETTSRCGVGYDYLYNEHGLFGCKHYCGSDRSQTNRPDGIKCLMPRAARIGVCNGYGYCVNKL